MSIATDHDSWTYLPDPPYFGVTDADGRFKLEHQISGSFIVVAIAERTLVDDTEHYVWTVPSSDISSTGELLLHNANMRYALR